MANAKQITPIPAREVRLYELTYSNGHREQRKFPSQQEADKFAQAEGDHLLDYKYLKSYYLPESWFT